MSYVVQLDANNRPVSEAISELRPVSVGTASVGVVNLDVPAGASGFMIKRCPIEAEVSLNGVGFFPLDEGELFTSILEMNKLEVNVKEVGAAPIIILFIL